MDRTLCHRKLISRTQSARTERKKAILTWRSGAGAVQEAQRYILIVLRWTPSLRLVPADLSELGYSISLTITDSLKLFQQDIGLPPEEQTGELDSKTAESLRRHHDVLRNPPPLP